MARPEQPDPPGRLAQPAPLELLAPQETLVPPVRRGLPVQLAPRVRPELLALKALRVLQVLLARKARRLTSKVKLLLLAICRLALR